MQYFAEDFDPQEYDSMMDLSGNENITLICHNETKKLIVRKTISGINKELYKQLVHVRHENLVQVMGLEETKSTCYTYEEYINGETLAQILANGPKCEEKALHWIRQLCQAVRLLHEQNPIIIHRDIKPGNIMLSSDGIIKLIDFDASKEFTPNQQRDTELVGTPNYAAPEQYGFAASDPRTDIYAIGILFHELITGYKPNEINIPYEGQYKKIIQKCIEFDPKRRYGSVQELECQLGMNRVAGFIKKLPGFHTGIWWKQVAASIVYIIIAVSMTGAVLYRYEFSKAVEQKIEDRQGLPGSMDKVAKEEHSVEDKQADNENVIQKLANGENQPQENISTLPTENKQPPVGNKENPVTNRQKKIRIPLEQVNITTYFAGMKMNGAESFDVAISDWRSQRQGEQVYVYFPRGTAIEIAIENNSGQDMINPTLTIGSLLCKMDDDAILAIAGLRRENSHLFYRKDRDRIVAGETARYRLPLEHAYLDMSAKVATIAMSGKTLPAFNIMFLADDYLPIQKIQVNINLAGLQIDT